VIHATAVVDPSVRIDDATVGPFAVLGFDGPDDETVVGAGTVIRSHSVVYRGVRLGAAVHVGHGVLIREHTTIGDRASVGSHCMIEHHVVVGAGARLHGGCFVPEHSEIGDGAWLGPGVIVTNARYPNRPDTKASLEGVHVAPGAVVGAGAVLLPGVTIGAGALVGAGAVVVRDVAEGARIVGNPGRALARQGGGDR
jgi:acetyltransferase-like isoleucine patch superfamily enzyme